MQNMLERLKELSIGIGFMPFDWALGLTPERNGVVVDVGPFRLSVFWPTPYSAS